MKNNTNTTNHTPPYRSPYDYPAAVRKDVKDYINENFTKEEIIEKLEDAEQWQEELHDALWIEDSVTGNASGSYTFSRWEAEENIAHNLQLLKDAILEFGDSFMEAFEKGAESCDVTIRCYLLSDAIYSILQEIENEMEVF